MYSMQLLLRACRAIDDARSRPPPPPRRALPGAAASASSAPCLLPDPRRCLRDHGLPRTACPPDAMTTTRALSTLLQPAVAAALLLISAASAQPLAPPAGSTGTCDITTLQARISTFNAACCTTAACFAGGVCSVDCATVLLPLVTDCMQFLGAMYDSDDGTLDGTADVFTAGAQACTSTPAPLAPPGGHSATCDLSTLSARVVSFNTACCTTSTCFAGGVCSVDCAMELLPLVVDCDAILDSVYDNTDGAYDGNVTMLQSGSQACLAISSASALARVQQLHDAGQCPDNVLDAVAEVQVTAPCHDTNSNCASFLTMGLACSTLQGQCDATCNFCTSSGGGHRRAQGTNLACNPATVNADIARINSVCCDTTGGVCATGVPTTCDAKCRLGNLVRIASASLRLQRLQPSPEEW
eukprot:COSAG01_NODE_8877_length_2628_cov_13.758007_3_plen_413_part_00